jgi:5-dehydro-2-deoxygluconokinase
MTGNEEAEVVAIGRIGVDFFSDEISRRLKDVRTFTKTQGGSVSNIAVGIAKLGHRTKLITRVGNEPLGQYLIEYLRHNKVDTSGVVIDPLHNTSLAVVEVLPPSSFTTLFFRTNCADLYLSLDDIPLDEVMRARIVATSGTSLTYSPARETVLNVIQTVAFHTASKPLVVFDIDYRDVLWDSATNAALYLWQAVKMADIVFANDQEIDVLSRLCPSDHIVENILNGRCKIFIHKHGSEGATIYHQGEKVKVSPYPSEVRSTNGAGDGFAAAFCHGVLGGLDLRECGQLGSAAGAIIVTRTGCSEAMPTLEEIESLRARYK